MTAASARPLDRLYVEDMRSAAAVATSPEPVFRARGLTKVYRMGDVEVHALRGVDLDLFEGELVLLGRPAAGSRRC